MEENKTKENKINYGEIIMAIKNISMDGEIKLKCVKFEIKNVITKSYIKKIQL